MIEIKTKEEIEIMRQGGRILTVIMEELKRMVKPGIATKDLDRAAEALVLEYKAEPAFKGYRGSGGERAEPFPAALCTSVNNVLVHGVPSDYILQEGDIVGLDLGIKFKDFYTDMAVTLPVGKVDFEALRLIRVAKKVLKLAIKKARPGNTIGDIGNTVQRYVEYQGFNVVRDLCGHGIGRTLHEDPQIANYGKRRSGPEIKEGMTFCLEPMVVMGDWKLKKSNDGFGYETQDGSLACHFETTVAITKNGSQILTKA